MLDEQQERYLEIRKNQLEEIKNVYNDLENMSETELYTKHAAFREKFPKTWKNLLDRNIQLGHLERNIEVYEEMFRRQKHRSYSDKKFGADLEFGEKLAEEYLYPTTGRPSASGRSNALKKVKKSHEIQKE